VRRLEEASVEVFMCRNLPFFRSACGAALALMSVSQAGPIWSASASLAPKRSLSQPPIVQPDHIHSLTKDQGLFLCNSLLLQIGSGVRSPRIVRPDEVGRDLQVLAGPNRRGDSNEFSFGGIQRSGELFLIGQTTESETSVTSLVSMTDMTVRRAFRRSCGELSPDGRYVVFVSDSSGVGRTGV